MALGGNGTAVRECAAAAWLCRVEEMGATVGSWIYGSDRNLAMVDRWPLICR